MIDETDDKPEPGPEISKSIENDFMKCENCGYDMGFHVHFKPLKGGETKVKLKCPNCGQTYDIGWKIKLGGT
ncbi:MAG: hypothetical protein ABH950_04165 [Candidatus Altiarchaeota archaeon]